ncbi:MAG: hypothetical protein M1383_00225 [Patescibacteria group bacterium]|nr:hypothetical protein [Patescibacteria group bacterium]
MNLAYFRKSNLPAEEAVAALKTKAQEAGFKVLGEMDLPEGAGKTILICNQAWLKQLLDIDHNLVGFLPCAVSVIKKGNDVLVGSGQTAILKALAQQPQLAQLAADADKTVKEIIHHAAGVEALKPVSVKLYSTMSCPYCKMEKSWLEGKNIKHEVVYVDLNQKEAEAMVQKTGQMGVPVTEIQYEDGEPEFIIGFDKPRLEQILT